MASLSHRNFRLYWTGLLVAIMGWQMLTFTQLWLVYELTHSTVYVGLVGGVNGASNIALSIFGGVFADRLDKRRLLLLTQAMMSGLSLVLAILTVTGGSQCLACTDNRRSYGRTAAFDSPAARLSSRTS